MKNIIFTFFALVSFNSSAGLINLGKETGAIYGRDEREFISKTTDAKIKKLSQSIALIVSSSTVEKKGLTSSLISTLKLTDKDGVNLCADEKFSSHNSISSCTGFLIDSDKFVSAGHCFMNEADCQDKKIVFQVLADNEVQDGYKVSRTNVYECAEVLKTNFAGISDFSLIRLSRKVIGRAPLKIRKSGVIALSDKVFMIGHPLGLPQVLSKNARVTETNDSHQFKTNLDSFDGNSGSPVFNANTLEVEGILVNGQEDFIEDSQKLCYRYQKYDESASHKGEGINRIRDIQ
jgi:hypothetical protein